jgi:uncharacterized protein DUF2460
MSTLPIFPAQVRGLTFTVMKTPQFDTIVQQSPSGVQLRIPQRYNPIWFWTLIYDYLKASPGSIQAGMQYADFQTLLGFFMSRQGKAFEFLFDDPDDDTVGPALVNSAPNLLAQLQLVTDGTNWYSPLQRNMGGQFLEDITDLNPASPLVVCANGAVVTNYTVAGPGLAIPGYSFRGLYLDWGTSKPTAPITAQFQFYFRCTFTEDEQDFEKWSYQLWTIGGSGSKNGSGMIKFQSSRLSAAYFVEQGSPPVPSGGAVIVPPAVGSPPVSPYQMQIGLNLHNGGGLDSGFAGSFPFPVSLPGVTITVTGPGVGGSPITKVYSFNIRINPDATDFDRFYTPPAPWLAVAGQVYGSGGDATAVFAPLVISQADGFRLQPGDLIAWAFDAGGIIAYNNAGGLDRNYSTNPDDPVLEPAHFGPSGCEEDPYPVPPPFSWVSNPNGTWLPNDSGFVYYNPANGQFNDTTEVCSGAAGMVGVPLCALIGCFAGPDVVDGLPGSGIVIGTPFVLDSSTPVCLNPIS